MTLTTNSNSGYNQEQRHVCEGVIYDTDTLGRFLVTTNLVRLLI